MGKTEISMKVSHFWEVECYEHFHEDGERCSVPHDLCLLEHPFSKLKWREEFKNIVVTAGLNKYLDATLKTGLTTPLWYVGLKDTGSIVAGDIMSSHAGWATITPYSNATDPAFTPGTISGGSVSNSAAKAVFNINATDDVYGAFMKDDNTKGGATGTLLGGADFGTMRAVLSGDTLNVQVTCTLT